MKKKRTWMMLAAVIGVSLLTGCGSDKQKIYDQAVEDLEQGSYEYALEGFAASAENNVKLPQSYRGAGIAALRLGDYEDAAANFTSALGCEKIGKALQKDVLCYRATAYLALKDYDNAMADCQTLAEDYSMDADTYFLTGKTALFMDSYDEAASNFQQAYDEDSTYDRAIQIYEAYLDKGMEADGTRYLEAALASEPKKTQDYCDRGRVYYYMQDYDNARKELTTASNDGSGEALLLLGMVYSAQNDVSNARAMYQQYVSLAEEDAAQGYNGLALCDLAEGNYSSALDNIAAGITAADTDEMESLLFNEIVIYEKMLDFSTARQKAKEYLDMFPDDKKAAQELAFLETRISDGANQQSSDQTDGEQIGAEQGNGE